MITNSVTFFCNECLDFSEHYLSSISKYDVEAECSECGKKTILEDVENV